MSTPSQDLTRLFAVCYIEAADHDGGFEYALIFAKSIIQHMTPLEIQDFLDNIYNGDVLVYDIDFGDFITEYEEAEDEDNE